MLFENISNVTKSAFRGPDFALRATPRLAEGRFLKWAFDRRGKVGRQRTEIRGQRSEDRCRKVRGWEGMKVGGLDGERGKRKRKKVRKDEKVVDRTNRFWPLSYELSTINTINYLGDYCG